jgi:hypothetical protein
MLFGPLPNETVSSTTSWHRIMGNAVLLLQLKCKFSDKCHCFNYEMLKSRKESQLALIQWRIDGYAVLI